MIKWLLQSQILIKNGNLLELNSRALEDIPVLVKYFFLIKYRLAERASKPVPSMAPNSTFFLQHWLVEQVLPVHLKAVETGRHRSFVHELSAKS